MTAVAVVIDTIFRYHLTLAILSTLHRRNSFDLIAVTETRVFAFVIVAVAFVFFSQYRFGSSLADKHINDSPILDWNSAAPTTTTTAVEMQNELFDVEKKNDDH